MTDQKNQCDPTYACETPTARRREQRWTYTPQIDLLETADAIVLHAEVPGATRESLSLEVEGDVLTIEASVHARQNAGTALRHEFGVGDFHRRFTLDRNAVDVDAITATCRAGVVTVTLPKHRQSRRIPVNA